MIYIFRYLFICLSIDLHALSTSGLTSIASYRKLLLTKILSYNWRAPLFNCSHLLLNVVGKVLLWLVLQDFLRLNENFINILSGQMQK